jgi:hypothetical protein
MECFERKAKPVRAQMEMNLGVSGTLAALRDTLLPKRIAGELRTGTRLGHVTTRTR